MSELLYAKLGHLLLLQVGGLVAPLTQLLAQELLVEGCPESQELHAGSFAAPLEQVELADT